MNNDEALVARELIDTIKHVDFVLHRRVWKARVNKEKFGTFMILALLKKASVKDSAPGMRVSELASAYGISAPAATQIITSLEERGLVERKMDPTDRRAVLVSIKPEGLLIVEDMSKAIDEVFSGLVSFLGLEKSHQALELMKQIAKYFDALDEDDPDSCKRTDKR